jgi:hypothetical protein
MTWGYRRVRQPLVTPPPARCSRPEEKRRPALLCRLQETKRCHKEGPFPIALDTLSGAEWFSILDLKCSYWQVALHPDNKEKTTFLMGQGLW